MKYCGAYHTVPTCYEDHACEPQPGGSVPGCIDEQQIDLGDFAIGETKTFVWQPKENGQHMVDFVFEDHRVYDGGGNEIGLVALDVDDITDFNGKSMQRNASNASTRIANRLAVASAQQREQMAAYGAGVGTGVTPLGKIKWPAWDGNSNDVQTFTVTNNTGVALTGIQAAIVFYTPDAKDAANACAPKGNGKPSTPSASGRPAA